MMKSTRGIVGIALIGLGAIGLIVKGIEYTRHETIVDVGPIEARAETTERLPIPTWLAVVVLAGGVVLLATARSSPKA